MNGAPTKTIELSSYEAADLRILLMKKISHNEEILDFVVPTIRSYLLNEIKELRSILKRLR